MLEDLLNVYPDGEGAKVLCILIFWGILYFLSSVMFIIISFPYVSASLSFYEESDPNVIKEKVLNCLILMSLLSILQFIFQLIPKWYLFYFSATFVNRIRSKIYRSVIRQPVQFFDNENTSGNITHVMSSDVKAINNAIVDCILMLFYGISLTIFSMVLWSFIYIVFTYITLATMPFIILALAVNNHLQSKNLLREKANVPKENKIISDSILNHLTISSLSAEESITHRYLGMSQDRNQNYWKSMKYIIIISIIYGISCYLCQVVRPY